MGKGLRVKKSLWLSSLFPFVCFAVLGFPLVYEYTKGNFSPRQLGAGFVMLIGCIFGLIVFRLSRGQTDETRPLASDEKSSTLMVSAVRKVRIAAVTLPIILVVGLWLTRGQPLLPRLAGALMSVFITSWLLSLLFRARGNAR